MKRKQKIQVLKAFLFILALLLVYWFFWVRQQRRKHSADNLRSSPQEKMVTCAYCRLNFPESESLTVENRHYCCDEHRRLDTA